MFGFVLVQAYSYMATDVDGFIEGIADAVVARSPDRRAQRVDEHLMVDPHRVKLGGLFAADGSRITGNIESLPAELKPDERAQLVSLMRIDGSQRERQTVRAVARRLADGGTVVIGRTEYEF